MVSLDASKSHLVCCRESLPKLVLLPEKIWRYFCTECWASLCVHAIFWHVDTHWHRVRSFLWDKLCLGALCCFCSQEIKALKSTVWRYRQCAVVPSGRVTDEFSKTVHWHCWYNKRCTNINECNRQISAHDKTRFIYSKGTHTIVTTQLFGCQCKASKCGTDSSSRGGSHELICSLKSNATPYNRMFDALCTTYLLVF